MNIILLPPSDKELDDAFEYYNDQEISLGNSFYNEFMRAVDLIQAFPITWKKVGRHTHKINIKRFPYLLLYVIDGNNILITCMAHQHRSPTYYIERIY